MWSDENQNIWTRNLSDTWIKLTPQELQVIQNKYQKVMTRGNSYFEILTEQEKIDALKIFNSQEIQSQLPDSFETIFIVKLLKSENPILKSQMQNESDKASEYLSKLYPGLRHNFD